VPLPQEVPSTCPIIATFICQFYANDVIAMSLDVDINGKSIAAARQNLNHAMIPRIVITVLAASPVAVVQTVKIVAIDGNSKRLP
jgi:hypothetical protein